VALEEKDEKEESVSAEPDVRHGLRELRTELMRHRKLGVQRWDRQEALTKTSEGMRELVHRSAERARKDVLLDDGSPRCT
jgi:hypothetical protein